MCLYWYFLLGVYETVRRSELHTSSREKLGSWGFYVVRFLKTCSKMCSKFFKKEGSSWVNIDKAAYLYIIFFTNPLSACELALDVGRYIPVPEESAVIGILRLVCNG